jgi:MFS family permease
MDRRNNQAFFSICPLYAIVTFFYGNWFSGVSTVEDNRGISNGTLSDFVAIAVIGALLALPLVPLCLEKLGSRMSSFLSLALLGVSFIILGINSNDYVFAFGYIVYGFATIFVYAATVEQGALLEKSVSQLWMGWFSAYSGLGGVIGGLFGGYLLEYTTLSVWEEMLIATIGLIIIFSICYPWLYNQEEEILILKQETRIMNNTQIHTSSTAITYSETQPLVTEGNLNYSTKDQMSNSIGSSFKNEKKIIVERDYWNLINLIFIASLSFFIECSIGDWGGIFLKDHWSCGTLLGIMGFVAEKSMIILAGLTCDHISTFYLNRQILLFVSFALILIGLIFVVVAYTIEVTNGSLAMAIVGFGIIGAGLGWMIPIWYSIAGQGINGFSVGETLAWTMTIANIGCLIEPVILGNISDGFGSLAYSYGFDILLTVLIIPCAYFIPPRYFQVKGVEP